MLHIPAKLDGKLEVRNEYDKGILEDKKQKP